MLIEAAKKIGFDAIGVNGSIDDIDNNNLPCIAHFIVNKNYKHFVVIYNIDFKNKCITIMDPAKGRTNLSFSEFNLSSSNNYIFLKPNKKLPIIKNKHIVFKTIINYFKNNRFVYIFILFLISSSFILNFIFFFSFKYLFICILIILLFKNLSNFLCNILLSKWILIFDQEITKVTFKQIILLPYLYFKNRSTGEVISRFRDLSIIKNFIST